MVTIHALDDKRALHDIKDTVFDTNTEHNVHKAIENADWDALRAISLLPGGFGKARVQAWYSGDFYMRSYFSNNSQGAFYSTLNVHPACAMAPFSFSH